MMAVDGLFSLTKALFLYSSPIASAIGVFCFANIVAALNELHLQRLNNAKEIFR